MSQTTLKSFLLIYLGTFVISCTSPTPYDHIHDDVRPIIENGIAKAGGLEAWSKAPGYQFKKRRILYLEDGSIESKSSETLQFIDQPTVSGSIISNNRIDTVSSKIVYQEGNALKYVEERVQDAVTNESAQKSFLQAHMTMSLPFILLDPGVNLTYGGEQEQFGKSVKVLIADYQESKIDTGSDLWWHYFDSTSYDYLGYKVIDPPGYALVENLEQTTVNGIIYPLGRITWRVDSLDNKQYIREKQANSAFKSLEEE